ncbi:lysozyme inhibitor LprI family protein [Trinickia dinghuensis]|nr:lysozyme inhibitor LprI family protein [Trinickia dinghuensis]
MSAFAQTADLDCAKPHPGTERTICSNAALRALDAQANTYYTMLLEAKPAADTKAYHDFRDGLQADRDKWQHDTRDACGAQVSCLSDAYQHRVDGLRDNALAHLGLTVTAVPVSDKPTGPQIDYKDAIYSIEGKDVTLLEGQHSQPAADGSSEQDVTRVVEPPEHAVGKLGGRSTVATFVSQDGGGSGTFYYVALVFNDGRATTFKVGDRIQPIGIAIHGDDLVISYLDRKPDEPMAVPPTVPRERHFAYMNGQILERPPAVSAAK